MIDEIKNIDSIKDSDSKMTKVENILSSKQEVDSKEKERLEREKDFISLKSLVSSLCTELEMVRSSD